MEKAFLRALCILVSLASASPDCTGGFTYHGCAVVDLTSFSNPLVFSDGLSPEACQKACQGHQLAALFSDCCRCGDQLEAVKSVEDTVCDFACMNDPSLGMCGSSCEPDVSTVYTRTQSPADLPPSPADSGVLLPPGTPTDQDHGHPPLSGEPSGPDDHATPGTPPGRGIPPNPKSVNPGMGSDVPESPDQSLPEPNPEVPDQGMPPGSQQKPPIPIVIPDGQAPSGPDIAIPNQDTPSQPEPPSGNPGPLNAEISTQVRPPSSLTSTIPQPSGRPEPESFPDGPPGGPALPQGKNTTNLQPPADAFPWPNPSGGLVTDGDPPLPSLVTGSIAAFREIPLTLRWSGLTVLALIVG